GDTYSFPRVPEGETLSFSRMTSPFPGPGTPFVPPDGGPIPHRHTTVSSQLSPSESSSPKDPSLFVEPKSIDEVIEWISRALTLLNNGRLPSFNLDLRTGNIGTKPYSATLRCSSISEDVDVINGHPAPSPREAYTDLFFKTRSLIIEKYTNMSKVVAEIERWLAENNR